MFFIDVAYNVDNAYLKTEGYFKGVTITIALTHFRPMVICILPENVRKPLVF